MPFFIGSTAISVIVTALFNDARGSILLPALFHWQVNNPLWPDAQPYDSALFVGAAIAVVLLERQTMLRRDGAVTTVTPGTQYDQASDPTVAAALPRPRRRPS